MNMRRAKEIYDSTGVIDVMYRGVPVWIEELHEDDHTANVRGLESDVEKTLVDVHLLVEREGIM